jgi:hypothetical protein
MPPDRCKNERFIRRSAQSPDGNTSRDKLMPDVPLRAPFEAYTGREPYLFASYAHADGAIVFPELTSLHRHPKSVTAA